jgi:hypothetical protein
MICYQKFIATPNAHVLHYLMALQMPLNSSALRKLPKSAVSPSGAVPREELPEKEIQGRKRRKSVEPPDQLVAHVLD